EIYAAILGSYESTRALPLVELDLSKLPEGLPKIASYDVKVEKHTEAHRLTKSAVATDLDEETVTRLTETAIAAYPNPWLSSKHEFAMAAKASGLSYTHLIGEILDLALTRYARRSKVEAAT